MKSQKSQWKEPSWWSDSFISSKLENFREQTTQKKTLDSWVLPNQCSVQLSPSNGFGFFVSSTKTLACCNPRMWRTARRGLKERGALRLLRAALCSRGKGDSDGWAKHLYYNLSRGREEESQACSQNQKEPKAPRFRKRWEERPSEGQLMRAWPLGAKARLCVCSNRTGFEVTITTIWSVENEKSQKWFQSNWTESGPLTLWHMLAPEQDNSH